MIWTRDSEDALSNAKSDKKVIISVSCSMEYNEKNKLLSCHSEYNIYVCVLDHGTKKHIFLGHVE